MSKPVTRKESDSVKAYNENAAAGELRKQLAERDSVTPNDTAMAYGKLMTNALMDGVTASDSDIFISFGTMKGAIKELYQNPSDEKYARVKAMLGELRMNVARRSPDAETMRLYGYYLATALLQSGLKFNSFDDRTQNAIRFFITPENIRLVLEA